jgi:ABC-2 type transport system permease protein
MNTTVARLTARGLLGRRRRVVLLMLLPAVVVVLAAVSRGVAGPDTGITVALLGGFTLGTIVPLLGLIVGTGAIGPEIDDGSIIYLLAKPLDRRAIVVSKFAVAVAVLLVVAALPTLVAGLILGGGSGLAVAYAVGATVAVVAYSALFLLLAVVSRNAVVVGLLYALIWESLIGGFVPGAQTLSIQQWALAVAERVLGDDAVRYGVRSAVEFGTAVPLLLVVIAGAVWYAGARLRTLRLTSDE